jgi:hypothetical protein
MFSPATKRRWSAAALGLGTLIALPGCADIAGKWSLAEVEPTAARRDFEYEVLTLQPDGTFYAEAREIGTESTSGTYTFGGGHLSLKEHDGERQVYRARFENAGRELHLARDWEDSSLEAMMLKTDRIEKVHRH